MGGLILFVVSADIGSDCKDSINKQIELNKQ